MSFYGTYESMNRLTVGDISLMQVETGLKFGIDALLLAAYVRPCGECAEFGAGSGAVSLLLASRVRASHVDAIEIQKAQYDTLEKNIAANGLEGRVTPILGDIRRYRPVRHPDAVVTNPPFMRAGNGRISDDQGLYAARHEVNGGISDFCSSAAAVLGTGGAFYCVWRPDRLSDLMKAMSDSGFGLRRLTAVHHDISHPASLVLCEARRGGASDLFMTKPLLLYLPGRRGEDGMTDDMRYIYENGEFDGSYIHR